MLTFPQNPALDALFPLTVAPGQRQWRWDGVKWVRVGGDGGGNMGVTDGSNAGPGEVGEVITVTQAYDVGTSGETLTGATLPLQPGDWQLSGHFHFVTASPLAVFSEVRLDIKVDDDLFWVADSLIAGAGTLSIKIFSQSIPAMRLLTSMPTIVTVVARAVTGDNSDWQLSQIDMIPNFIQARRMR
jgi:hypothetical protein